MVEIKPNESFETRAYWKFINELAKVSNQNIEEVDRVVKNMCVLSTLDPIAVIDIILYRLRIGMSWDNASRFVDMR